MNSHSLALKALRAFTLRWIPMTFFGWVSISVLFVVTAAASPPSSSSTSTKPKLVPIHIKEAGIDADIMAPEDSKVEKNYSGGVIVRNKDYSFDLVLEKSKLDTQKQIEKIKSNEVNKLVKWIEKTDNKLVFESRFANFSQSEFHFFLQVPHKVRGKTLYCRDQDGSSHKLDEVAAMIDSCNSIK